jgi:hypothetical protein
MLHFATLFDINYLTRGLALYQSMQKHISEFTLYVLALDDNVTSFFADSGYSNIRTIHLTDIEKKYPELIKAKNNRSIVEYYFTLSPVLPLYLLETNSDIDFITTLDADIYFFSSPEPIFTEFKKYSILITKHDFTDNLKELEKYGKYNVSFQSFRNNKTGIKCLKKWKKQCVEWCYDKYEDDKFADQKYLDNWKKDFEEVMEIGGNGAGIAPWNIAKYDLTIRKKTVNSNNSKLIFYHFHGLRFITKSIIKHSLDIYKVPQNKTIKIIYKKYIMALSKLNKKHTADDTKIKRLEANLSKKQIREFLIYKYSFYKFANFIFYIHLLPIYKTARVVFFPLVIIKRLIKR